MKSFSSISLLSHNTVPVQDLLLTTHSIMDPMESITDEASGSTSDSQMESSATGQRKKLASASKNEVVNEEVVNSFDSNLDLNSKREGAREMLLITSENDQDFCPAESKAVFWLKLTVLAVLIASALSVALTVYFYTSNSETDQFEEHFHDSVEKVFDSYLRRFDRTLGIADSFVLGLVSYATHTNQKWPFVTLPDFGKRLAKIRTLAKATMVAIHPLVTLEQREQWQNYSLQHDDWVQEGLDLQANDTRYHGKIVLEYEANDAIHNNYGPSQGPGPFLPQWQNAPVVPIYAPYNWDGASYEPLAAALPDILQSRRVVISKAFNLPDLDDSVSIAEAAFSIDWVKDYISGGDVLPNHC
jgi:hypothetical protein